MRAAFAPNAGRARAVAENKTRMNSIYDDAVLQKAMKNFGAAERAFTSEEMKLTCRGLFDLAFAINDFRSALNSSRRRLACRPCGISRSLLTRGSKDDPDA